MKDVAFCSFAFGPLYVMQQERLRQSILKIYPEANIRFWHCDDGTSDNDLSKMPKGAKKFKDSMYGFKVHCVGECYAEGFKKIIFLDAAMFLDGKIDSVMELASEIGVVVAVDPSPLYDRVSDKCLDWCQVTREYVKGVELTIVGGSLYVFDFNVAVTEKLFTTWYTMEAEGLFGSEEEAARGEIQGHRSDEACMSLALYEHYLEPVGFDQAGYRNLGSGQDEGSSFVFCKLHFKGIGTIEEHSFDESLLPFKANILDLGCRGFVFTDALKELEHSVYSVDIGEENSEGLKRKYFRIGISHENGWCGATKERDPDATSMKEGKDMMMMTLDKFKDHANVDHWHLIKMDIEGAEYEILKQATHPIADQVSVEFHAHCGQTKEQLDELLDMLEEFYYIHNRVWEPAHSLNENFWDILLIAK